eukprot:Selendium_serpulae@DN4636_c0_g1_i3.p1
MTQRGKMQFSITIFTTLKLMKSQINGAVSAKRSMEPSGNTKFELLVTCMLVLCGVAVTVLHVFRECFLKWLVALDCVHNDTDHPLQCNQTNPYNGGFTHLVIAGNFLNFASVPPDERPVAPHMVVKTLLLGREATIAETPDVPQGPKRKSWWHKEPISNAVHARQLLGYKWWSKMPRVAAGVADLGEGFRAVLREGIRVIWLPGDTERGLSDVFLKNELHKQLHLARDAKLTVIDSKHYWEKWGLRVAAGSEVDIFSAKDPKGRRSFSYYLDRLMARHDARTYSQRKISKMAFQEAFSSLRMSVALGTPQLAKPRNCRRLLIEALRLANNGEKVNYDDIVMDGHWNFKLDDNGDYMLPNNETKHDVTFDEILEEYQTLLEDWITLKGTLRTEDTIRATAYDEYSSVPGFMGENNAVELVAFGHTCETHQYTLSNGIFASEIGGWTDQDSFSYVDVHIGFTTKGSLRPVRLNTFQLKDSSGVPRNVGKTWTRGLSKMSHLGVLSIITTSLVVLIFILLLVLLIAYCIKLLCPMSKLSKEDLDFIKCRRNIERHGSTLNDTIKVSEKKSQLERQYELERERIERQKTRQFDKNNSFDDGGSSMYVPASLDVDEASSVNVQLRDHSNHRSSLPRLLDHRTSLLRLYDQRESIATESRNRRGKRASITLSDSVCPHLTDIDKIVEFVEETYSSLSRKKINQLIKREYSRVIEERDRQDEEAVDQRRRVQELLESVDDESVQALASSDTNQSSSRSRHYQPLQPV